MFFARIFLPLIALFVLAPLASANSEAGPGDGLLWILPGNAELKTLKPEDGPRQAKRDGLYDLINGGAGVFLQHGFKQAVVQDYRSPSGTLFNLEVFQMDSPANAQKIFTLKAGTITKKDSVGQGSSLEDYYGLYWQGPYFITVTASEGSEEARGLLKQIARAIIKKIQSKGTTTK